MYTWKQRSTSMTEPANVTYHLSNNKHNELKTWHKSSNKAADFQFIRSSRSIVIKYKRQKADQNGVRFRPWGQGHMS